MKQLEDALGAQLWEKVNKRIWLTETGTIVLDAARDILRRIDQLEEEVESGKAQIKGVLDIGVVTSAKHFLPQFLGEFVRMYPNVKPRLSVTNRASVLEALAENRHDLYIMGQIPDGIPIETHPFLDNILEVVAASDHPLLGKERISLKRLAKEPLLVREHGSGTRIAVARLFAKQGIEIEPFMELGSTGAIKNAVIAGLGIAVLSRHSLEYELKSGAIAVLDAAWFPLHRRWYAGYPSGKHLSLTARTFLDFLTQGRQENSQDSMCSCPTLVRKGNQIGRMKPEYDDCDCQQCA